MGLVGKVLASVGKVLTSAEIKFSEGGFNLGIKLSNSEMLGNSQNGPDKNFLNNYDVGSRKLCCLPTNSTIDIGSFLTQNNIVETTFLDHWKTELQNIR